MPKGMLGNNESLRQLIGGPILDILIQANGKDSDLVVEQLGKFSRRELCWTEESKAKTRVRAPRLDTLIEVDRSQHPPYPSWVGKALYPDFEKTGPPKYRLNKVGLWLHPSQENGSTTGNVINAHLRDQEMLKDCLGLADAIEIQKKGIEVYRKFFGGKVIYFWKSVVVRNSNGYLHVPCLYESGDEVMLDWYWLDDDWFSSEPAARFAS